MLDVVILVVYCSLAKLFFNGKCLYVRYTIYTANRVFTSAFLDKLLTFVVKIPPVN